MLYFRRFGPDGIEFAALDDRRAGGIFGMLLDGWRAEYIDDVKLVREIVQSSVDDLLPEHALAMSCADLSAAIGDISEDYETEDDDVNNLLYDEIKRKVYYALLDWGDGGTRPGQVARYHNAAGANVKIDYREGWKR